MLDAPNSPSPAGARRPRGASGVRGLPRLLLALGLLTGALSAQLDPELLRERLEAGDHATVLDQAVAAAKAGALDLEIALLGAEAALHLHEWNHASSLTDVAKARAPDDPRGWLLDGHHYLGRAGEMQRSGRASTFLGPTFLDGALAYRAARERGGDPYVTAYHESEALLGAGRLEEAAEAARIAREARPDDLAAALHLTRILLRKAEDPASREAALAAAREALEIAPGSVPAAALLIEVLGAVPDGRDRLRTAFLDLVERFPEATPLYNALWSVGSADSPPRFLRETLLAALERVPQASRPFPHWYLGRTLGLDGRYLRAMEHISRYLEAFPEDAFGHVVLGGLAARAGELDRAEVALREADALGGTTPEALGGEIGVLVRALVESDRWDRALPLQRRLVDLVPGPATELDLGVVLYQSGREEEAIATYRGLLSAARDDVDLALKARVWNYLGLARFGRGELEGAESAFREAIATVPNHLDALENLGLLLLEKGAKEKAIRRFDQVLAADPERVRSRYHRLRARENGLRAPGR